MRKFSSLSFQFALFLGGFIFFMILFFSMSWFQNRRTLEYSDSLKRETGNLNATKDVRHHFGSARKEEKNWFLFKNPSHLLALKKSVQKSKNILSTLKAGNQIVEMAPILEALESDLLNYMVLSEGLIHLTTTKEVDVFTKKAKDLDTEVTEEVAILTNLILGRVSQMQFAFNLETQREMERLILFLTLAIGLFIVLGGWWLRRFRKRWKNLVKASQKMAMGDYSPQLDDSISDELGILAVNFNQMGIKLAAREEKISEFTQELIQANNLLKKGITPISRLPKTRS